MLSEFANKEMARRALENMPAELIIAELARRYAPSAVAMPTRPTIEETLWKPDVEYIRNDALAMGAAGWVPAAMLDAAVKATLISDSPDTHGEVSDLRVQLATARNDALEEAVEAGEWPTETVAFPHNALDAYHSFNGDMNAAIALAEAMVPEWRWGTAVDARGKRYAFLDTDDQEVEAYNEIPARALLLAIIAAKKVEVKNG